jgi:hypothetical protein
MTHNVEIIKVIAPSWRLNKSLEEIKQKIKE